MTAKRESEKTTARRATLHEIIEWCTQWAEQICDAREGDFYADSLQVDTLTHVIDHCKQMAGED